MRSALPAWKCIGRCTFHNISDFEKTLPYLAAYIKHNGGDTHSPMLYLYWWLVLRTNEPRSCQPLIHQSCVSTAKEMGMRNPLRLVHPLTSCYTSRQTLASDGEAAYGGIPLPTLPGTGASSCPPLPASPCMQTQSAARPACSTPERRRRGLGAPSAAVAPNAGAKSGDSERP